MKNPFEVIDLRLSNIENLLLEIKHSKPKLEGEETLPELLTRQQVADYLSISLKTVDNLTNDGLLKKYHIAGSTRFKREEVRETAAEWKPYQRN